MKILFHIKRMSKGGAERVTNILINELSKRGYDIYVVLKKQSHYDYPINENVHVCYIPESRTSVSELNSFIKSVQPDVMIGVMSSCFYKLFLASIDLDIPIIASEHTNFRWFESDYNQYIKTEIYRFANIVTVLTENDKKFIEDRLNNVKVMYNPLTFPILKDETVKNKIILCAGDLNRWEIKGFDRIIQIWGNISKKYQDWTLYIAGAGNKENNVKLRDIIKSVDVQDSVQFLGHRKDIKDIMAQSSIFTITSREEGFPCVLLEAMSQGCAPVSFEIHGNIKEIITDGKDGFLIKDGDLDSFQEKLELLINNEELRNTISKNAIESMKRFETDKIINQWEDLLKKLTNK